MQILYDEEGDYPVIAVGPDGHLYAIHEDAEKWEPLFNIYAIPAVAFLNQRVKELADGYRDLENQLTTLQSEKEAFQLEVEKVAFALTRDESEDDVITILQVAASHLEGKTILDLVNERDELRAEVERLQKSLDVISNLWTCPDCGCKAKQGSICPGCGLNHPMQSTKQPPQEPGDEKS